jgi:thiamine kinase-like enzyme
LNQGLVQALRNSRPNPSQYNHALENEILKTQGDQMVFTHGDLGQGNIIFYEGKVAVIDFGSAGYSLEEWEFTEAMWQASLNEDWESRVSSFTPDFTQQYLFWDNVVNEMRRFSGI